MIPFTSEQIQDKFEKLPKDLQDAISSAEVRGTIQAVGEKHSLLIDQLGEMVDLIGLIMLGLSPSKDFVKNFSREANVDIDTATEIANDINTEVFGKIRSSMQQIQAQEETKQTPSPVPAPTPDIVQAQKNISNVESAGRFKIEKENSSSSSSFMGKDATEADKGRILYGIEDRPSANRIPIAANPGPKEHEAFTEPLVDQLLSGATARTEEKVVQQEERGTEPAIPVNLPTEDEEEKAAPAPAIPDRPRGPDAYREQV
ncbi:MAG: hypothetical protein WC779_08805 [Candidatus Omnitrophota bacterium]|jgi:hypothetical protein